jgi:hypothetical protein
VSDICVCIIVVNFRVWWLRIMFAATSDGVQYPALFSHVSGSEDHRRSQQGTEIGLIKREPEESTHIPVDLVRSSRFTRVFKDRCQRNVTRSRWNHKYMTPQGQCDIVTIVVLRSSMQMRGWNNRSVSLLSYSHISFMFPP